MPTHLHHYDRHAAEKAERFESVRFEEVHRPWLHLLPTHRAMILDVGAGSGRDAAHLVGLDHEVIAVEPSEGMREQARRRHPEAGIHWLDDRLPTLQATHKLAFRYDVILLSAVWMHVPPGQRERAFRKLADLLKPGGILVITLRLGEADASKGIHPVSADELRQLARGRALDPVWLPAPDSPDALGRADVSWSTVVFRSPDDGTGALPLLRHIIVNDAKSSTYKLALLRVLTRIADGARGMVLESDEHHVTVPLGLVALYWYRAYRGLIRPDDRRSAAYPQQGNVRAGLGFVGDSFRKLSDSRPVNDLRVGMSLTGPDATLLTATLSKIGGTIRTMPARFTTYPGSSDRVFVVGPAGTGRIGTGRVILDRDYLARFGTMKVPLRLWDAMSRYACWLEPAILNEWVELMRGYDERQERKRPLQSYYRALAWYDPERDTTEVRRIATGMIDRREKIFCVWTGRRLKASPFEIDHCFPFARWPNGDLWNLLPASRSANNRKRDRLPSAELLLGARERIADWWQRAYADRYGLGDRFRAEAYASLPLGVVHERAELLDVVFAGVDTQRARLKTDQQLEEWGGGRRS